MRLIPVAFDSFGVKGMCTRIETPDLIVTIDPGVSIQTGESPLPEKTRIQLLSQFEEQVLASSERSDAIVISHYHLDHFLCRREPKVYAGKIIFAKALDDLPEKQQETAKKFFKTIDGLPKEIIWADARKFKFKKTEISFSEPIWHGKADAEPGRVMMTVIIRGKNRVLISSDIAGPVDEKTTDLICEFNPQEAVIDGYPTFLQPEPQTDIELVKSIVNICRILCISGLKTLVLDHHLCRDYRYPVLFKTVYQKAAKLKKRFGTVSELAGRKSAVLEGLENYGTTRFHRWQPLEPEDMRATLQTAVARGEISPEWLNSFDRWVLKT